MPYRNERYRRRKQKRTAIIGIVVAALLIEIVVVIVLLSRDCSGRRSTPDLTSQPPPKHPCRRIPLCRLKRPCRFQRHPLLPPSKVMR